MTTITIKGKDYPLQMTTKYAVQAEEKLGYNPLNIFVKMQRTEELPPLKDILIIFHFCLQKLNHGISFEDTLNLYDDYIMEDGDLNKLIETIIYCFKESGLIKIEEDDSKNV